MALETFKCGDNATLTYNDTPQENEYHFVIEGNGVLDCSSVFTRQNLSSYRSNIKDDQLYRLKISEGITELKDNCFPFENFDYIVLPSTLSKIGSKTMRGVRKLVIPDTVKSIGSDNFQKLVSIIYPTNGLILSADNFTDCTLLSTVEIPMENPLYTLEDGVVYSKDFKTVVLCPRTKYGTLSINQTTDTIGEYCFAKCQSIHQIIIPDGLKAICENAFSHCKINKLVVPATVTKIGKNSFEYAEISQLKGFKGISVFPNESFYNAKVSSFKFPKGVTSIGEKAFYNASIYSEMHLEECRSIAEYGLYNYEGIERTIYLSNKISHLANNFIYNQNKTSIHILSATPPNVGVCDPSFTSCQVYVPKGCTAIYRCSNFWSRFYYLKEWQCGDNLPSERQNIECLLDSYMNADRNYLSSLLSQYIDELDEISDDNTYEKVLSLTMYNRRFNPALLSSFEQQASNLCDMTYQLRYLKDILTDVPCALNCKEAYITHEEKQEPVLALSYPLLEQVSYTATHNDEVLFTNILDRLVDEINSATQSIKVAVAWFTNYKLFELLKAKKQEGLVIEVIINNDLVNNGGYCLDFNELIEAGVNIHLVEYPNMLHHKFCIVDDKTVITGSYNWTRFSAKNHENVTVLRKTDIVNAFVEEFSKLKELYVNITQMPEKVPARPEYDRSSFKQYITEELDAEARETSDNRARIIALRKAATLNREYLTRIRPNIDDDLREKNVYERGIEEREQEIEKLKRENKVLENSHIGSNTNSAPSTSTVQSTTIEQNKKLIQQKQEEIEAIKKSSTVETRGKSGKIRINLKWFTLDDLDLHVILPNNEEIFYSKKSVTFEGCTGTLDIDANAGNNSSRTPQENIYWDKDLPLGKYVVKVVFYSKKDTAAEIPYTVTLEPDNGNPVIKSGKMVNPKEEHTIITFESTTEGIKFLE